MLWVGKVPLLLSCLMKEEGEARELVFLRYTECVSSLLSADEALRCTYLQYTNAGSAEESHDVGHKGESEHAVVADECFGAVSFQSIVGVVYVNRTKWCGTSVYDGAALK